MKYIVKEKVYIHENVVKLIVSAPLIAEKALPGQFAVLRVMDGGERIPLTIAAADRENGTITLIFQVVGKTTAILSEIPAGGEIRDVCGPLGRATEVEAFSNPCVIGGGIGSAVTFSAARWYHENGRPCDVIAGFRNSGLIILEAEMRAVGRELVITTDDGSYGEKGFVTDILRSRLKGGAAYDCVLTAGPVMMMKAVTDVAAEFGVKTLVSLNPLMIDGTGMCGCCRVRVRGEMRFACIDGPDFIGGEVDFFELNNRLGTYKKEEACARENCRIFRTNPA